MADGDLFIHVQVEVEDQTTVTVGSGSAGTVDAGPTAGTVNSPRPGSTT